MSAALHAGPIEDASKLLEQGQFDEVDTALGETLAQPRPPVEALQVSLKAAMADGRFITAERRIGQILENIDKPDAELVHQAAILARLTDQIAREAEMLSLYTRLAPEKSDRLKVNLLRLTEIGSDGDAFTLYVKHFGGDDPFIIQRGIQMLGRLYEDGQAKDYASVADAILALAGDQPSISNLVTEGLRHVSERGLFLATPGTPLAGADKGPTGDGFKRYGLVAGIVMRHPIHNQEDAWRLLKDSGQASPQTVVAFGDRVVGAIDESVLDEMNSGGIWGDGHDIPAELVTRILAWESRCGERSSRDAHREFAEWVTNTPDLFRKAADASRVIDIAERVVGRHKDRPEETQGLVRGLFNYCKTPEEVGQMVQRLGPVVSGDDLRQAVERLLPGETSQKKLALFTELTGGDSGHALHAMHWMQDAGEHKQALEASREYMLRSAGHFDSRRVNDAIFRNDAFSVEDRVGLLDEIYQKAGYTSSLKRFVEELAKTGLGQSEEFKQFQNSFRKGKTGSDPIFAAGARMLERDKELKPSIDESHRLVAVALKAYGAKFPAGKPQDSLMHKVLDEYYSQCGNRNSPEGRENMGKYVETLLGRISADGPWYQLSDRAEQVSGELSLKVAQACLAEGLSLSRLKRECITDMAAPQTGDPYFFSGQYAQMDPDLAWTAIKTIADETEDRAAGLEELSRLLQVHEKLGDRELGGLLHDAYDSLVRRVKPEQVPDALLEQVGNRVIKPRYSGALETAFSYFGHAGKLDEAAAIYRPGLGGATKVERFEALSTLLSLVDDSEKPPIVEELFALGQSLDAAERQRVRLDGDVFVYLAWRVPRSGSEEVRKRVAGMDQKLLDLVAGSLPVRNLNEHMNGPLATAVEGYLQQGDMAATLEMARLLMQVGEHEEIRRAMTLLRDLDRWEILYLVADHVDEDDKRLHDFALQQRGVAAAKIPGLNPVSSDHPSYPLYVASGELLRGNEQQAWELLRANLEPFIGDPLKFDADFVVWAIDKLRQVRGSEDAMIKQSRVLCEHILAEESDLQTEFIAHVTLLRANIFRDLGELEAAELECQTLLNTPKFQKTDAGREARYRLVDLMIARGNAGGATERIERWLSFPDPELHLQAYYYKAKLAFEEEDFKVCREMLNQVFEREFGHEQARLLEGEWRKATKALEDTDIYAGRRVELSVITPGEELKLSIHDKNLSVIGEGSSIPVVVTTEPGNDRETVNLYLAPRAKNLFRSRVGTQLGDANPGNLVMELTGRDTIRYEIDPKFLADRGIEGLPAKTMRVVDDGWMSASAGRLLSEAEQKELALRRQVAAIRGESLERLLGNRRIFRPGNPIYVMVRDRDRDQTGSTDVIEVSLETSSGDRLSGATLTETAPHSAMFYGMVPTSVSLPRAYASDSAEGKDPSTLINSSKPGTWSTRPDAGKDKWVEVDTMSGHVVKRAALTMASPLSVGRVDLYGSYQGQEVRLGRFPGDADGDGEQCGGLTLCIKSVDTRKQFDLSQIRTEMRAVFREPTRLDQPVIDQKTSQKGIGHMAGTFFLSEGVNAHFTLLGKDLGDIKAYLTIDGAVVMGGAGNQLAETTRPYFLSAGAHRLEVFFFRRDADADFTIAIKPDEGPAQGLPAQWFSVEENAGLAEFLQDKAKIVRTDEGFTAGFDEPTRLRKLRWQFTEYTGVSVTAESFTLTDADGKQVLPVADDFSTGLANDQLEVAPGDRIVVSYRDARNSEMQPRVLREQLEAAFANGRIGLYYELSAGMGQASQYAEAFRFRPGDQLTVIVREPDGDVSDKADTIDLVVRTAGGKEHQLQALETGRAKTREDGTSEGIHSGTFAAILKTSLKPTNDPDTIQVRENDRLQVSYVDEENTDPGVPTVRRSQMLSAVRSIEPEVTFYRALRGLTPEGSDSTKTRERVTFEPLDPTAEDEVTLLDARAPLNIDLFAPSRAIHSASTVKVILTTDSEAESARQEGRKPRRWLASMKVSDGTEVEPNSIFENSISMQLGVGTGTFAENGNGSSNDIPLISGLPVLGADIVHVTILDEQNKPQFNRSFKLATDAAIQLLDHNYEEPDHRIHMGEQFYVQVNDPDQDVSAGHDQVTIAIRSPSLPKDVKLTLTETLPHSGVFNGSVRTLFVGKAALRDADGDAEGEAISALSGMPMTLSVAPTMGVPVNYGEKISFVYDEQTPAPAREPGERIVFGQVLLGADGTVALFSKRYLDRERGARVQFRLAECLFEMAKEYRKVKNAELAANAIAQGREVLEEAMQDYPDTSLVIEGTYLLANLHQELAAEQMANENEKEALKLYQQAIGRFSSIINTWPDSPFAARAQFHKAMCLEKIGDDKQANEEYVRLCYAYPDSPLIADATVRLATHFYRQGRYDVSGRIYENFARNYSSHPNAAKVMFMAAQSHMKQAQTWTELLKNPEAAKADPRIAQRGAAEIRAAIPREYLTGAKALDQLVAEMGDAAGKDLCAQAMYWCGIGYYKGGDLGTAYLRLKELTFDYPDSKWARMARGLLLQNKELAERSRTEE